jgi:pimeloyl-ACP methyl ester carboxylesterase
MLCPYTPNVARASSPSQALDAYGRWLVDVVLPKAQVEVPKIDAAAISIDGCSMGGYVGLEVFLRHPSVFQAWGSVQMAIGEHRVDGYADRLAQALARVGPRPLHLETSEADPFRGATVAMAKALRRQSVPHELVVLPGPHDQPWLREVGTLEMLLWHDRLRGG